MRKKTEYTVSKRSVERKVIGWISEEFEKKNEDPVLRLAQREAPQGSSKQITLDDVYEGKMLLRPPFSMQLMAKLPDFDPYMDGAVDAIARNVSACDFELVWKGEGKEPAGQREELEGFFFEDNDLENPMSLQEKLSVCTVDYVTLGSWNMEIVEAGGRPVNLVHAPAEFIRIKKDFAGYLMVKNEKEAAFAMYGDAAAEAGTHQILRAISKKPGHRVYGKPQTLSLVDTVFMNALRDNKHLEWFDQGMLADLLIILEENLDKTVKEQLTADFQNSGDGSQSMFIIDNAGKAVIEQLKRELESDSENNLELNHRQRVLTALGVPPAEVAIYEDANRANTITQDESFRMKKVTPIRDTFRMRFNHLIKHRFGFDGWELKMKPRSLKDQKEEADIADIYIKSGVYTVNEVLENLNKPPVDGGDRRVMNTPLGLVDLATMEIAVADPRKSQGLQERLAEKEAGELVMSLIKLKKQLQERK